MKVAITGSSGLAKIIKDTLEATPYKGDTIKVSTPRIDDIIMNDIRWWGFDYDNPNHVDVLINFAHRDFDQTKILEISHRAWKNDSRKYIINVSSRAAQPNISKGYIYSAQKSSLNHLANNYHYNSNKQYKMTTINLGLLNHDLPSVKHQDVAGLIHKLITSYPDYEIADVTLQAHSNYMDIQTLKETMRSE